jgi:hypothetical protein
MAEAAGAKPSLAQAAPAVEATRQSSVAPERRALPPVAWVAILAGAVAVLLYVFTQGGSR